MESVQCFDEERHCSVEDHTNICLVTIQNRGKSVQSPHKRERFGELHLGVFRSISFAVKNNKTPRMRGFVMFAWRFGT